MTLSPSDLTPSEKDTSNDLTPTEPETEEKNILEKISDKNENTNQISNHNFDKENAHRLR